MRFVWPKHKEMEPNFSLDGPPVIAPGVVGQQPNVIQGREIPVYTIDDQGPDPTVIWKRLSVLLLGCIVSLIFMLVLKSFSC